MNKRFAQREVLATSVQIPASPGAKPQVTRLARLMTAKRVKGVLDQETVIGEPGFVHSKSTGLHIGVRASDGKRPLEVVHIDCLDVHPERNSDGGQCPEMKLA